MLTILESSDELIEEVSRKLLRRATGSAAKSNLKKAFSKSGKGQRLKFMKKGLNQVGKLMKGEKKSYRDSSEKARQSVANVYSGGPSYDTHHRANRKRYTDKYPITAANMDNVLKSNNYYRTYAKRFRDFKKNELNK